MHQIGGGGAEGHGGNNVAGAGSSAATEAAGAALNEADLEWEVGGVLAEIRCSRVKRAGVDGLAADVEKLLALIDESEIELLAIAPRGLFGEKSSERV